MTLSLGRVFAAIALVGVATALVTGKEIKLSVTPPKK